MTRKRIPETIFDRLLAIANTLSRGAMWVAGGLTLMSAFYISIDVIIRKAFNMSLGGSDELSGYAFAISISWALSFATLQRANIRIDTFYQFLSVRVSALLDFVSLVSLGVFIVYLTRYALEVAETSWALDSAANSTLATPLWIPQYLWAAGFLWLCVVLAIMLVRSSIALVTGDLRTVNAIAGIISAEDEALGEAEAGKRLIHGEPS